MPPLQPHRSATLGLALGVATALLALGLVAA